MSNRLLLVAVATLVLLIVGLMTGPAFSGEHPWDSDRTDGGRGTKNGLILDTAVLVPDTVGVQSLPASMATPAPGLIRIVRIAWAAMMAM